jgi:CCR4-NOT transcription complex subunit 1
VADHLFSLVCSGRYLLLSAIANHLRYPNKHTQYFSCVLLYLFTKASQEAVKEQIARVLVERLIVARPHPWGLLTTFIELIKVLLDFYNMRFLNFVSLESAVRLLVSQFCVLLAKD